METATDSPALMLAEAIEAVLNGPLPDVSREGTVLKVNMAGVEFAILVTEAAEVDPLAHLKLGDTIDRAELRDRDNDERCTTHMGGRYDRQCSRKAGHPGQHLAWSSSAGGKIVEVMVNASSPTATGGDPLDGLREGDRLNNEQGKLIPGWKGGSVCSMSSPNRAYECTRPEGHEGKHIATYAFGAGAQLCCDPWETKRATTAAEIEQVERGDPDPTKGPSEMNPCRFDIAGDPCTRPYLHDGKHISGDGKKVLDCREEADA